MKERKYIDKLTLPYVNLLNSIMNRVNKFYKNNDEAHQIDHALDVLEEVLYINKKIEHTDNIGVLIVAAMYHDIFANKKDRAKHHVLASEYVLTDSYISTVLSTKDILKVSVMIGEHRASFKGERSNMLSEMLSVADLGRPDLKSMLLRSINYHKGNDNVYEEVIKHHKEKFGYGGYVNYPKLYKEIYGDQLTELKDDIEKLVSGELKIGDILRE